MLVSWSQLGFNQATSTALLKDASPGVSTSLMMNELNAGMEEWVGHTLVWPASDNLACHTEVDRQFMFDLPEV